MDLLIGADPEVFVKRKGVYVSGHTFPLGSKEKPTLIASGAIQNDGLALEFNVNPSRTRVEFINNTVRVYKDLNDIVKSMDAEAELDPVPTVEFGNDFLSSLPPKVAELGCNPDFNAYLMGVNDTPNADMPIRTGSGHVHVGFTEGADPETKAHFRDCASIVRQLDYYLGLPSLAWDKDRRRRDLYGKAGAFRPKSYGLEYRVLSNRWLSDEDLMGFVFDRTRKAYEDLRNGIDMSERYGDFAQQMIDTSNDNWMKYAPDEVRELAYA